jgi:hypothetical protein
MQLEGRLKAVEDVTKIHNNKHQRGKFKNLISRLIFYLAEEDLE